MIPRVYHLYLLTACRTPRQQSQRSGETIRGEVFSLESIDVIATGGPYFWLDVSKQVSAADFQREGIQISRSKHPHYSLYIL